MDALPKPLSQSARERDLSEVAIFFANTIRGALVGEGRQAVKEEGA